MAEIMDPFGALAGIFKGLTDFASGIASGFGGSGEGIAAIFPMIIVFGLAIYMWSSRRNAEKVKDSLLYIIGISVVSMILLQAWGNAISGQGIFHPMLMTIVMIMAVGLVCASGYVAWGYLFHKITTAQLFMSGAVIVGSLALTVWLLQIIPEFLPPNMSIAVMSIRASTFSIIGLG